ncbi:hypothetical protein OH77DRAFT_1228779 [Trametes cingulata]|nr:hypothetical protein OH77DRAFT_1228779 [Trametes cingulata]
MTSSGGGHGRAPTCCSLADPRAQSVCCHPNSGRTQLQGFVDHTVYATAGDSDFFLYSDAVVVCDTCPHQSCPTPALIMATSLSPASDTLPRLDIDKLYGALLLGTFISLVLYGVSLHQLYQYVRRHWRADTVSIRCLVVVVMALQTLHIVVLMHTCYYYLVSNFFEPTVLAASVWSLLLTPVITAWITVISQVFFARRVSLIDFRYRILVAIAVVALLMHLGLAFGITVLGFQLGSLAAFKEHQKDWLFSATTGVAAVADGVLSTAIILALRQSRAHHQRSTAETAFERAMLVVGTRPAGWRSSPPRLLDGTSSPARTDWRPPRDGTLHRFRRMCRPT